MAGKVDQPLVKLALFGFIVLSLFHWGHHFRYTLYDGLQLSHLRGLIATLWTFSRLLDSRTAGAAYLWATMVGKTLSHYRIVEKLGEGGMGVVWKALDTQLDREVAIKVLPETFSADVERVARFKREAKLLASLNHRNIAAIYGLDEAHEQRFLVMELVEGEDLARKLGSAPLPVEEAIDICHQLARALEAAHEKGVLHRDLKPANVQVTPEGRVKVLDFGLAKAFGVEGDPSTSPTLTSAGTRAGTILGTVGYMSPEQARGKALDKRTDIWSFGCILFECLTGRPAFRGETVSDTLAAILKSDANWSLLPEHTPPRVRELLQRCFEKDARNRLRDIGDARLELQRSITGHESLTDASGALPAARAEAAAPGRRLSLPLLVTAVLAGVAIGALVWSLVAGTGEPAAAGFSDIARFSIRIPDDQTLLAWAASPDGRTVVYTAQPRLPDDPDQATTAAYVRRFDATESVLLEGSAGLTGFAFSPDGRWIAARVPVSPKSTKFRLVKLRVDGSSPPLTLMELPDSWFGPLGWLPDGDLLMGLAEPRAMIRVPSDGGRPSEPIEIVNDGFEGLSLPTFSQAAILPDGKHVLGNIIVSAESGWNIHVGLVNVETGRARIMIDNGGNAKWSPTGHLLFTRGDTLLAVPFDPRRLELTGAQVAVTDGLFTTTGINAGFDVFPDGTLLHTPGGLVGGERRIMFIDAATLEITEPWSEDRRPFEGGLTVSDDGARLAVSVINVERFYEIWTSDMDRPRLTRLVRGRGEDCTPGPWHPDGERLVYRCFANERNTLYIRSAEGAGEPRKLVETTALNEAYIWNSFTPDGAAGILTHWLDNEPELMLLSLDEPDAAPVPLLDGAQGAEVSLDGRFLLYVSDTSGQDEVYLRSIDAGRRLGRETPVTSDGCSGAWWGSRAGETPLRVRYVCSSQLYEVDVTPGEHVRLSEPRRIGDLSAVISKLRGGWFWDLRDGRFLAVIQGEAEEIPRELTVVVNWRQELEQRLRAER